MSRSIAGLPKKQRATLSGPLRLKARGRRPDAVPPIEIAERRLWHNERRKVGSLIPCGLNPNINSDQQFAKLKQSIKLIDQIVDKMPHGPVQAQEGGV